MWEKERGKKNDPKKKRDPFLRKREQGRLSKKRVIVQGKEVDHPSPHRGKKEPLVNLTGRKTVLRSGFHLQES